MITNQAIPHVTSNPCVICRHHDVVCWHDNSSDANPNPAFWNLLAEYEVDVINSSSDLKAEELEHDLRIYIQMLVNLYRQNSIVKVTMKPDPANFEFEADGGWSRTYAIKLRFSSTEDGKKFFPTDWVRSAVASNSMEWGFAFRIRYV